MKKAYHAALFLLLLLQPACALFLVGEGNVGDNIHILCEGQTNVLVLDPSGDAKTFELDENFQTTIKPVYTGPHTIQCGKEAVSITVAGNYSYERAMAKRMDVERAQGIDILFFILMLFVIAVFVTATAFVIKRFILDDTEFMKIVEGKQAKLSLRAGKTLEAIKISDPVEMGHYGGEKIYEIPSLRKGAQWSIEYEINEPEKALPATLDAKDEYGDRESIISQLFIEGIEREDYARQGKSPGLPKKRRLEKNKEP